MLEFSCGCKFPVVDRHLDIPDIVPENCKKTWDLICEGLTWGVFQIDSSTGQKYSEEAKPNNIDELADVLSVIRPGTLGVKEGAKNLAQHYCDRKHNRETADFMHSSVEDILKDTQQIIVYQEQAMAIAKKIAGFTGPEADHLRKILGKKLSDLMPALKAKFIDGAIRVGLVNEEKALEIFQGIEAAQRYSFNKCLCPETTFVELENGELKNLNEVNIGDRILDRNKGYTAVVDKYNNGKKEIFTWTLESGESITCTSRHKFLCSDGKIRPINIIALECLEIVTKNGKSIVDGIQCKGFVNTVDLEVSNDDHLFIANGMVTSNSHAVSYSKDAYYYSAYIKAHFPRIFYCTEIQFAKDNDYIKDAINDAKKLNISVVQPCLKEFNVEPIIKNKNIVFPLGRIKYCSESHIKQIEDLCKNQDIDNLKYVDWLLMLKNINKRAAEALIKSGALDFTKIPRDRFFKDFDIINKLTGKKEEMQLEFIKNYEGSFSDAILAMIDCGTGKEAYISNKRVIQKMSDFSKLLKSHESIVSDNLYKLAEWEKEFLGIELTCTKLDSIVDYNQSAYECIDIFNKTMDEKKNIRLNCIIDSFSDWENENGKTHCFLKVYDSSCVLDCVMFDKNYSQADKSLFYEGNTVVISGKRSGKNILIDTIKQI